MSVRLHTRAMIGIAGLALLVFVLMASVGSPPKAAADTSDCPATYVCIWEGDTFGGNHVFIPGSATGCWAYEVIGHSARNHTGNHVAYFGASGVGPGGEINLRGVLEVCIS